MQEFIPDSNIYAVDALYTRPLLASIHLVREGDEIAIVDTGTQYSVPQIEAALQALKLDFSAVKLIILTHIHLDHAGGASALMARCPNATLVVHPRGARHMAEPEKLIQGTMAVYGEQMFKELYGEITPIEVARIIAPEDGDELSMGARTFEFLDTPGHASHHFCIVDRKTNSVFTGDTLGLAYRALRDKEHAFVMPTTTPVQFNPDALHNSIERVMARKPSCLYYTHYSALVPSERMIASLHEQIDDFVMLTEQAAEQAGEEGDLEALLEKSLSEYAVRRARNELKSIKKETILEWVGLDTKLNAQGLAFWWQHRR